MFLYPGGLKRHTARTGSNKANAKSANNSRMGQHVALVAWRCGLLLHVHGLLGPEFGRLTQRSHDVHSLPINPANRSRYVPEKV